MVATAGSLSHQLSVTVSLAVQLQVKVASDRTLAAVTQAGTVTGTGSTTAVLLLLYSGYNASGTAGGARLLSY